MFFSLKNLKFNMNKYTELVSYEKVSLSAKIES